MGVFLLLATILYAPTVRAADPDWDGDGLSDAYESSVLYVQRAEATGLPVGVPDEGSESASASLLEWRGLLTGAFANFTIDHSQAKELTVQVGHWNGSAWVDRYVWDPGGRLLGVDIAKPQAEAFLDGIVEVAATVPEDETVDRVEFSLGTKRLATVRRPSSPETYTIKWDTRDRDAGTYTLTAVVTDKVGAQASASIPVHVDHAVPKVTVTNPSAGSIVSGLVMIESAASDDFGVKEVRFFVDGEFLAADATAPYTTDWDASALDGSHRLKVVAVDHAGKQAASEVSVLVDNLAPRVSLESPMSGDYVSGTIRVLVAAMDENGVQLVELKVDGGSYVNITANHDGIQYFYDWNTGYAKAGSHTLTARAADPVGKASVAGVSVIVDNTAPSVSITKPSNGATVAETVLIKASASDNIGVREVRFVLDGYDFAVDAISPYEYYWNTKWTDNGWHKLEAVAVDYAGFTATRTISVRVLNSDTCRTLCPTVALTVTTEATSSSFRKSGTVYTVVADLIKLRGDVTAVERDNRILPAEFDSGVFHANLTWRIVVRDWVASVGGGGGGRCTTSCPVDVDPLEVESTTSSNSAVTQGTFKSFALHLEERSDPVRWDTDGDGVLSDGAEATMGTFPVTRDTDGDGLEDLFERDAWTLTLTVNGATFTRTVKTDPTKPDTDGDGLNDGEERTLGSDRAVTEPTEADTDADGLRDGDEAQVHRSNATRTDTDEDTIPDNVEVSDRTLTMSIDGSSVTRTIRTAPYTNDTDADGLRDAEEIAGATPYGVVTDPSDPDTDRDGLLDGHELVVQVFRAPDRYPIPDPATWYDRDCSCWRQSPGQAVASIESVKVAAPASQVVSVILFTGFTHPDAAEVSLDVWRNPGSAVVLRAYGANGGTANNFTAFDLLELGFERSDITSEATWTVRAKDDTDTNRGQLEYTQIQVTMRTPPTWSDIDGDGLTDSEEVTLGSDGYQTDPWKRDTDGDGLADDEYFATGTDPTRADTDRDGDHDGVDRVPLGDAFVTVRVTTVTPWGGADDDGSPDELEPFVSVRVGNQTAWTRSVSATPGASGSIDHAFSANVPDSEDYVEITVRAWDYDADNTHEAFEVATFREYGGTSGSLEWIFDHRLAASGTESYRSAGWGGFRLDPIVATVATVIPPRIDARLVVPGDYSGVYNVTDPGGTTVDRRYVGEPQLVGLLLNVTTSASWRCLMSGGCDDSTTEPKLLLVPRSVFFETMLAEKLAAGDLTDLPADLTFRQNSTAASRNSDALQQLFSGNVTGEEYFAILDLLLRNVSGGLAHAFLVLTNDLFLYSLRDDSVQLVAYGALPSTPSAVYAFAAGTTTKPWWELLWEGLVASVSDWIESAIVFAANAFVNLVQVLRQVGEWIWTAIGSEVRVVQQALEAASKAIGQFVDWTVNFVVDALKTVLSGLLNGIRSLLSHVDDIVEDLALLVTVPSVPPGTELGLAGEILILAAALSLIPVAIRVAEVASTAVTSGLGWVVSKLVSSTLVKFVIETLALVALSLSAAAIFATILESIDWIEEATLEFVGAMGLTITTIVRSYKFVFNLVEAVFHGAPAGQSFVRRWGGVGLSLTSIILLVTAATVAKRGLARAGIDLVSASLSIVGLVMYVTAPKSQADDALEGLSPVTATFGRLVAFGSPPIVGARIATNSATGVYDG